MKYQDSLPIYPYHGETVWMVNYDDGERTVLIVDKSLSVPEIIEIVKRSTRKFSISSISVGEYRLDKNNPILNMYQYDARMVDQDLNIFLEKEKKEYAIAIQMRRNEFGFIDGPNPSLEEMISRIPSLTEKEMNRLCVVELPDKVIYRWNTKEQKWISVD